MSISSADVDKIAKLAKLDLSEDEREKFSSQLSDIVSYMEKLNRLDTKDVEPLAHVNDLMNVSREDKSRPSMEKEDVFKNSPQNDNEFFLVPKVLKT
ncbi:MAG: Asp-tRNA(Asn)/Glu-tRNA(Gln) amidotransferase subunit GatC [Candidatus Marinimicrobia bacterium]|nr:Asp-tRNA(Asn)/Glu-tRNA(Gln) amidotransferase subunit GatC [Candidatus Neomarinimicrobiota bacterium]MCH7955695.1 Asp-tRNA(Asn)/Glu-tRNA(Gln) amidotransferase subunit GatC [Candidatus Neomarinimicrobiota bacterium]